MSSFSPNTSDLEKKHGLLLLSQSFLLFSLQELYEMWKYRYKDIPSYADAAMELSRVLHEFESEYEQPPAKVRYLVHATIDRLPETNDFSTLYWARVYSKKHNVYQWFITHYSDAVLGSFCFHDVADDDIRYLPMDVTHWALVSEPDVRLEKITTGW